MYVPVVLSILAGLVSGSSRPYYGKKLGYLSSLEHGVSGTVYAVDSKTLHIRGFNYDGQAPDAYFYVGLGRTPSGRGKKVPAQDGSLEPLGRYRNEHITLTLPKSTSLEEVQWISVWCHDYSVDFGSLILPKPITDYPRPQKIGRFVTKESGVKSGEAVVVDSKTLLIPYFSYDGDGPDAHFWAGRGDEPTDNGFIVPNENGNNNALSSYDHKTIVLTLPGEKTVFDIDYLSVWCESYGANFGHLKLDHRYLNVPPSLRVLGVRPQPGYSSASYSGIGSVSTSHRSKPTPFSFTSRQRPTYSPTHQTPSPFTVFRNRDRYNRPSHHTTQKPDLFLRFRSSTKPTKLSTYTEKPTERITPRPYVRFPSKSVTKRPSQLSDSVRSGNAYSLFNRNNDYYQRFYSQGEPTTTPPTYEVSPQEPVHSDPFEKLSRGFNFHQSQYSSLKSSAPKHDEDQEPGQKISLDSWRTHSPFVVSPHHGHHKPSDDDKVNEEHERSEDDKPDTGSYSHFTMGGNKVVSIRYRFK